MSYTYFVSFWICRVRASHFPIQIPSLVWNVLSLICLFLLLFSLAQSKQIFLCQVLDVVAIIFKKIYGFHVVYKRAHSPNPKSKYSQQTHNKRLATYSLNEMVSHINNSIILHSYSYDGFEFESAQHFCSRIKRDFGLSQKTTAVV